MKIAANIFAAMKRKVLLSYHRRMARSYRKAAQIHANNVILMLHRVPSASLAKLRGFATEHDLKAKAIRIGE
ncbi:hypothetical protein EGJ28_21065 [Stutzerimonas xanthomarina]|jgi:hypothetical protein|uniref:Transposase n=1 Tax=Stutzerimonas xanthomarina TaxID=271420 RepID=A0A3R8UWF8_9GAMM|nr:hypothetical protein [Stutzerimonas xanthomarina]RRV05433.1 hypothetical protein EGJ28_21065 [Stutzerimonas xanthomarina]